VFSLADDSEAGTAYPSGACEFIPGLICVLLYILIVEIDSS
jgi:hypothetical protein